MPLIAHPERTEHFYEMLSRRVAGSEWRDKAEDQPEAKPESFDAPRGFLKRFFSPRATRHAPRPLEVATPYSLPELCLFQANLGSFTGYYGETVQRRAYELLKNGIYSALASDLHDGVSASKALVASKFETNPLLKKLAEWDGTVQPPDDVEKSGAGQGELF